MKELIFNLMGCTYKYITCYTLACGIKRTIEKYMDDDRTVIMTKEYFGYSIYYDCPSQNWAVNLMDNLWNPLNFPTLPQELPKISIEAYNGCTLNINNGKG